MDKEQTEVDVKLQLRVGDVEFWKGELDNKLAQIKEEIEEAVGDVLTFSNPWVLKLMMFIPTHIQLHLVVNQFTDPIHANQDVKQFSTEENGGWPPFQWLLLIKLSTQSR